MSVYIGIYGFLAVLGLTINKRTEQYAVLIILWMFLVWFMGWRYETGCDFGGYLNRFNHVLPDTFDPLALLSEPEPAFHFITLGLQVIGAEYVWVNVVCSAIIVTCFLAFCASFRDSLLIGALLFPVMIVQLSMSGLRQGLACGFIMLGVVALQKRRALAVMGLVVVATQFHSSAVILLPMMVLAFRKINIKTMALCGLVIIPAALQLLGDRGTVYQDRYINDVYGEIEADGAYIRYILVALPSLLFMQMHCKVQSAFPKEYRLFVFTVIAVAVILPIGLINTVVLHRLIYYIMPLTLVLFVYQTRLLSVINRTSEYRLLPVIVYGAYTISWFILSSHATRCYVPYKNYLLI